MALLSSFLYTSELYYIAENKLIGDADASTIIAVTHSSFIGVPVAEFLNRDLGKVSEWCDLWMIKFNATKTMIVSRSCTMHPQSPPLTTGGTVLKESDYLDLLGTRMKFDSKMTFEKHRLVVSRAASLLVS